MKKLISILIPVLIVTALAVGVIFVTKNVQDKKEYTLSISASDGGKVQLSIDDKDYEIGAGTSDEFTVTKKSKLELNAVAKEKMTFVKWQKNDKDYSLNKKLKLSISKNAKFKAVFAEEKFNVVVKDGTFEDSFKFSGANGILEELNSKYTPREHYTYVYKIGETEVTSETKITQDVTITRIETPNKYSLIFKYGHSVVDGGNVEYTVENKDSIVVPALPVENGYTFAWPDYTLEFVVGQEIQVEKSIINYPIKFVLPEGYEFVDSITFIEKTYTVLDEESSFVLPSLTDVEVEEHYEMIWPEFTFDFDEQNSVEVMAVVSPIVYSVKFNLPEGFTFENESSQIVKQYTVENKEVVAPAIPDDVKAYFEGEVNWSSFDTNELKDFENVTLSGTATSYTVKFMNGSTEVGSDTYTILDRTIEEPEVPTIAHYETRWEEYDLTKLENKTVELVKTPVEYTVTFKNGETEIATETYDIENKTITVPEVPTVEHYDTKWDDYDLTNGGNIVVVLVKTPTQYNVTYKLPEGYAFADSSTSVLKTYTIETDLSTIELPSLDGVVVEKYYELAWPTVDLNYTTNQEIVAQKFAIQYTVTFVEDGNELVKKTYSIETYTEGKNYYGCILPETTKSNWIVYKKNSDETLTVTNLIVQTYQEDQAIVLIGKNNDEIANYVIEAVNIRDVLVEYKNAYAPENDFIKITNKISKFVACKDFVIKDKAVDYFGVVDSMTKYTNDELKAYFFDNIYIEKASGINFDIVKHYPQSVTFTFGEKSVTMTKDNFDLTNLSDIFKSCNQADTITVTVAF